MASRSWITLRFNSVKTEDAFLRTRKDQLVTVTSNVSFAAVLCGAIVIFYKARSDTMLGDTFDTIESMHSLLLAGLTALCLLFGVLLRTRAFTGRLGVRSLEALIGTFMGLVTLFFSLFKPTVLKVIFGNVAGYPFFEGRYQAMTMWCNLMVCSLTMHMILPSRWISMAWVDLASMVAFSISSRILLDEWDWSFIVAMLIMTLMIVSGGRRTESNERQLFEVIAQERTRRALAEFRLSSAEEVSNLTTREQDPETTSCAMTTVTDKVFTEALDGPHTFTRMIALGAKEQWLIGRDELEVNENVVLGSGGCSQVASGHFCKSVVAVKRHRSLPGRSDLEFAATLCNEVRIMRHVRHPNIVLFHGACLNDDTGEILLVMEKVNGISLEAAQSRLQGWKPSSPCRSKQINVICGICEALVYLHSRRPAIVHADLKPSNVMIEERRSSWFPRVLDFGLACAVTRNAQVRGGSPIYMAPEIILNPTSRPQRAADIFALGMLMFYVASGRRPLANLGWQDIVAQVNKGRLPDLSFHPSTLLLEQWSTTIPLCIAFTPECRATAEEVHERLTSPNNGVSASSSLQSRRRKPQRKLSHVSEVENEDATPDEEPGHVGEDESMEAMTKQDSARSMEAMTKQDSLTEAEAAGGQQGSAWSAAGASEGPEAVATSAAGSAAALRAQPGLMVQL